MAVEGRAITYKGPDHTTKTMRHDSCKKSSLVFIQKLEVTLKITLAPYNKKVVITTIVISRRT